MNNSINLTALTLLMDQEISTQKEIHQLSCQCFDEDKTLDEALAIRGKIDLKEMILEQIQSRLIQLADQYFSGYSHPGGLTEYFLKYSAKPPSTYAPGCYFRKSG